MIQLQSALRLGMRAATAVFLAANLLAALALVAFGWRAGGFALNGPASCGYLLLTALATVVFGVTVRRADAWAEVGHIVLAPALALVVAGVWYATALFGATYAPYGVWDDSTLFTLVNAAYVLLGCGLALGLRWPRLLLAWVMAHGLALVVVLGLFGRLLYAALVLNLYEFLLWLGLPVGYALAALALGWRPTRQTWRPSKRSAVAGLALGLAGLVSLLSQIRGAGFIVPLAELAFSLAAAVPGLVWVTAFILPVGWHAWRAQTEWDPEQLARTPAATGWIAFVGAFLFGVLAAGYLLSAERLPRAGEVQAWMSLAHVVPLDAWLPTLGWSATLLVAARWLLVPIVGLGLVQLAWERPRAAWSATTWLLAVGVAAVGAWGLASLTPLRYIPNVVLTHFPSPWSDWGPLSPAAFLPALGLLLAARLWERPLGVPVRAGLALFTVALLAFFLAQQAAGAWTFARFLFWPQVAWGVVGQVVRVPPGLLASLGLGLHLLMLAFGVVVAARWLREMQPAEPHAGAFWPALRRLAGLSGGAVLVLGAAWYGLTVPRPLRVVPAPGATGVPLDTVVLIEFPAPSGLDRVLAGGFIGGLESRYADTGEVIPGTTGAGANGLTFDPEGLLRPGAVVEIIGHWSNKQPYVLRFTTAGLGAPSATALPLPTHWPSPVPTAPAPN